MLNLVQYSLCRYFLFPNKNGWAICNIFSAAYSGHIKWDRCRIQKMYESSTGVSHE